MKKIEAEGGESLASFFGRFHDVLPNLINARAPSKVVGDSETTSLTCTTFTS